MSFYPYTRYTDTVVHCFKYIHSFSVSPGPLRWFLGPVSAPLSWVLGPSCEVFLLRFIHFVSPGPLIWFLGPISVNQAVCGENGQRFHLRWVSAPSHMTAADSSFMPCYNYYNYKMATRDVPLGAVHVLGMMLFCSNTINAWVNL